MTILTRYAALQAQLAAALKATGTMRLQTDLAASGSPGDVFMGPPAPLFEGMCGGADPTGFAYQVYLVEALDPRAVERLLRNLPGCLAAVESLGAETRIAPDGVTPAAFTTGTTDMPAYRIDAETTLAEDDDS